MVSYQILENPITKFEPSARSTFEIIDIFKFWDLSTSVTVMGFEEPAIILCSIP